MIERQSVIEYLNRHPSHSPWQMRLHFLQATRHADGKPSVSIGTIANQLNYILRDLEVTGKITPQKELATISENSHQD